MVLTPATSSSAPGIRRAQTFTPISGTAVGNRRQGNGACRRHPAAAVGLFFGKVFGVISATSHASAVAMVNPRDICFVVDLSSSMNDDTDPNDTASINQKYPGVGTTMMDELLLRLRIRHISRERRQIFLRSAIPCCRAAIGSTRWPAPAAAASCCTQTNFFEWETKGPNH